MKKSIIFWQTIGFIFTGIAGVILHFLFGLTNESIFVAPFSAVNESVWEHMKLLFFPMFAFAVAEYNCIGKEYEGFWSIKRIGILVGLLLIPILYYTINGVFGMVSDFVNVMIFYIAAAFGYVFEYRLLKKNNMNFRGAEKSLMALGIVMILFFVFTFVTPKIPLFEDPVTNSYGYQPAEASRSGIY